MPNIYIYICWHSYIDAVFPIQIIWEVDAQLLVTMLRVLIASARRYTTTYGYHPYSSLIIGTCYDNSEEVHQFFAEVSSIWKLKTARKTDLKNNETATGRKTKHGPDKRRGSWKTKWPSYFR